MSSLWVQGYTSGSRSPKVKTSAFPVGTGIYRFLAQMKCEIKRVPCRYRDIPHEVTHTLKMNLRSL